MDTQWVIKSGGAVVHGPVPWNPLELMQHLALLGWSVHLGLDPATWVSPTASDFVTDEGGEAPPLPELPAVVLPCAVICPPFNPDYQVCTGPTFSGPDSALVATYVLQDRDLDIVKREASKRVNDEAGEERSKYITVITGQDATYLKKEQETERWLTEKAALEAAGQSGADPDPTRYPYIKREAELTGAPMAERVALIAATAAAWNPINVEIEGKRQGALEAIKAAQNVSAVAAVFPIAWAG